MIPSIGLGCVDLTKEDIARAVDCLKRGQLSPGPTTQEFEQAVAKVHQLPYATYCNSGQSALHLILEALKTKGRMRRVVIPALTYISSLHAVWNAGLKVQLVDVDPQTYVMDWEALRLYGDDVVMPVHLFGYPCLPPKGLDVSNWTIVEDACESLGAPQIGYGDAMALSFYVAHTLTTGVGGMVLTRHDWLDDTVKRLCNHGRARAQDLYAGLRVNQVDTEVRFRFTEVGFSYKLGDVNAALGIGQVQRLPQILRARRAIAQALTTRLQSFPLQLPYDHKEIHTYMMYPIVCREEGVRDPLMAHLALQGIETRHMMPVTNQPIVQRILGDIEERYPHAARINRNGFYLGCHQRMSESDCDRIGEAVRAFYHNTRGPRG